MKTDDILKEINFKSFYSLHLRNFKANGQQAISLCPFHDDKKPSLSINLENGLFKCFGCGASGNVFDFYEKKNGVSFKEAKNALAKEAGLTIEPKKRIVKTYDYMNEEGKLLFQTVRYEPKDFRQRQPDSKGGWINNIRGVKLVPYNLPNVLRSDSVLIVEGEKDADRLNELGFVATCNAMGAGKWKEEYNHYFKAKKVVIIPDNDDVGRKHSRSVANNLYGIASSVKVIELPDLKEKGDVSDWLSQGHTKEELIELINNAPEWQIKELTQDKAEKKETQKEALVRLCSNLNLFHDDLSQGFAFINNQSVKITSKAFKQFLIKSFYNEFNKIPNNEALQQATSYIEAKACYEGKQIQLFNRVAEHQEAFYYDLGNGLSVRTGLNGWSIEPAPILFQRFQHQQEQCEPKRGGSLNILPSFLNVKDKQSKLLLQVFCVACLIPDIPKPILHLYGDKGSGKTTAFKLIKNLIDPSKAEVLLTPKDYAETIQAIHHHYLAFFDNLSGVKGWFSDLLSVACTGGGFTKRALFTDDDDVIFNFKRVIGINGINLLIGKADLMDRAILINLERLKPNERQTEQQINSEFQKAKPYILGACFDALAKAMQILPNIETSSLSRMADFHRWGLAIAEALGYSAEAFEQVYQENITRQNIEILNSNTLAQAVISFMADKDEWNGTVGTLHTELTQLVNPTTADNTFPKHSNKLRKHLEPIRSNLYEMGITFQISNYHTRKGALISLLKVPILSSLSSQSSQTRTVKGLHCDDTCDDTQVSSQGSSHSKSFNIKAGDDGDDSDDKILTYREDEITIDDIEFL